MMDQNYNEQDYLMHYGVVGMKWGMRKARNNGVTYAYKSHGQKKYENKVQTLKSKNAPAKKIKSAETKLQTFKQRDLNRQQYAAKTNVGKGVAKTLLMGPFGAGNYNRLRAAGKGRLTSALASNIVSSTLGMPITIAVTKHVENKAAKKQIQKES